MCGLASNITFEPIFQRRKDDTTTNVCSSKMELINSHDILIKSVTNKWHGELNGEIPPQLG